MPLDQAGDRNGMWCVSLSCLMGHMRHAGTDAAVSLNQQHAVLQAGSKYWLRKKRIKSLVSSAKRNAWTVQTSPLVLARVSWCLVVSR